MKLKRNRKKRVWSGIAFVREKLSWILGALALFFFLLSVILWSRESECVVKMADWTPKESPEYIDNEITFGWNYKDDYVLHDFVCKTCCCDESRKDYIYVSNGYVEFNIRAVANRTNTLIITVGNLGERCRKNDVYVNGFYVGDLNKETNGTAINDFTFNITPQDNLVHVKVEHVSKPEDCWWGNDLVMARTVLA